jgi:antitoxin MazE
VNVLGIYFHFATNAARGFYAALDKSIALVYISTMEAMVQKWGNSLGIRIPSPIVRELSLKNGSVVNINDNGNEITIKPVQKSRLSEMLERINDQNIHQEITTTGPVGKEAW